MRPIRTTTQGFGPHENTTVDWSALASPIAITAPSGTGKTWTIETVIAALFGTFAWYGGSIYDGLTQGGTGEGKLEIEFEHNGEIYLATRTVKDTGKTRTQRAELYKKGSHNLLAGPKVSDFDRAIQAMVGDVETALATWFLSQSRLNDLCGQPGEANLVARRRAVFNALIGADALDAIEKRVADAARKSKTVVEELEAQLAGGCDPSEILSEKRIELDGLLKAIEIKRAEVTASEQNVEEARKRLRDVDGGDEVLHAQVQEYERSERALSDLRRRAENLTIEIRSAERVASDIEDARKDVAQLDILGIQRAEMYEQKTAYEAWEKYSARRFAMGCELKANENLFASLGEIGVVDQETIDLSGRLEELRAEYQEAVEANKKTKEENQTNERKRQELSQQQSETKAEISSLKRRIENRPKTLFAEKCDSCPLVQDYVGLPEQLQSEEKYLAVLQNESGEIPEALPEIDIAAIKYAGERAATARKSIEDNAKAMKSMESARANHEAMQSAYAEYVEQNQQYADGEPFSDPRQDLVEVQEEMDYLAGASERVKACELAAAIMLEKERERSRLYTESADIESLLPNLQNKAADAKRALADREQQRAMAIAEVAQKQKALENARDEALGLSSSITRIETQIEEIERRAVERQEKYNRAHKLRDDLDGYADLRKCFGQRGVRQILIDAAAPELEAIADDLFQRATGGRMRLRIATQAPLQDGSIAETFQILVRDHRGERDALRFSGGELQLVLILFRISVAIWVGNLRGCQPDCLFLDEAFDRCDKEILIEDMLRVVEYLSDKIGLVVVVTHDPQIAARMRSQVRLEKRFGGVEITTS